ncbi:MAG: phage head closure protein [Rhizobiaceae bacterium]
MRAEFIDPGVLRTELALEAATPVPDGAGGHAVNWQEVATVFARLEPLDASERFGADQRLERITHRITLRARPGLSAGMRFRRNARRFLIVTVHDPDETGRYLVCRTREDRP